MHMWHMIDENMIYVYGLLTLILLVDVGLIKLSNLTHMSKGAMHRTKYWGRGVVESLSHPTRTPIIVWFLG